MDNKQVYQTIGSMIVLVTLFGGAAWLVKETNEKTSCRRGFEYIEEGERQGYWGCETKSSTRYEICFEVYNSSNTKNYWCKRGEIIELPLGDEIITVPIGGKTKSGEEHCTRWGCV